MVQDEHLGLWQLSKVYRYLYSFIFISPNFLKTVFFGYLVESICTEIYHILRAHLCLKEFLFQISKKVGMISTVTLDFPPEISRPMESRPPGSRTPVFLPSAEPKDLKGLIWILLNKGTIDIDVFEHVLEESLKLILFKTTGAMRHDVLFWGGLAS